jgi:thiol-disulfide isomerase/thioredoxin
MKKLLLTIAIILIPYASLADDIWIFSADWCGPCKSLKSFLKTYHKTLEDQGHRITIVDIDDNPELQRKYNVRAVPTTIVFGDNKNEKDRLEGFSRSGWPSWIQSKTK